MSRQSAITPAKLAKMRELRDPKRKGGALSLRETAAKLGISFMTVSNWEKKHGAKRKVASPTAPSEAVKALTSAVPGTAEDIKARSRILRPLLQRLAKSVERGEYPATNFVQLMRYADELDRLLVELSPAPPKDPENDPNVRDAERTLLAKLEIMIGEAEARRAHG